MYKKPATIKVTFIVFAMKKPLNTISVLNELLLKICLRIIKKYDYFYENKQYPLKLGYIYKLSLGENFLCI